MHVPWLDLKADQKDSRQTLLPPSKTPNVPQQRKRGSDNEGNEPKTVHARWRSLFAFARRAHTGPLLVALVLSIISGAIMPTLAIFLGWIFDSFTAYGAGTLDGDDLSRKVSTNAIYLVVLGGASWLLNGTYFTFWLVFGELQAKGARDKLFASMLEKEMAWYDMRKAGINAMIPRTQTQIRELQLAASQPLGFAIQYTITTLVSLGLALYTAWDLTLVTIATVPLGAVFLAWMSRKMQPAIEAQTHFLSGAAKITTNAFIAINTVKCCNAQEAELRSYGRMLRKAAQQYIAQARFNALQIGTVRLLMLSLFVQGFWYGSNLVKDGKKTSGQVLTAFWACLMATQTFEQILPQMIILEKGRAAAAALQALVSKIDQVERVAEIGEKQTPGYVKGEIQIKNVSFAYPSTPGHLALSDATFYFPAGETSFVIGKSGSGKSTVSNLLLRFYVPTTGEIMLDGRRIETLNINWLRNNVTLVQQETVLFNETVFKNVTIGHPERLAMRKEQVKDCIEFADLKETVLGLPDGPETVVGLGGKAMSGGQQQRIAVARARLRNTPILVLDEATSALDQSSKLRLTAAIRRWRAGKTTIIVTHDISQISQQDYVYVLEHGRVVQEGFRNALERSLNGPFAKIFLPQVQAPQPPTAANDSDGSVYDSRASSVYSQDSLDIQIPQGPTLLPVAYQASRQNEFQEARGLEGGLVPVAAHLHRMTSTRMSMKPLQPRVKGASGPLPLSCRQKRLSAIASDTGGLSQPSPTPNIMHATSKAMGRVSRRLSRMPSNRKLQSRQGDSPAGQPHSSPAATDLIDTPTPMDLTKILRTVWPQLLWKEKAMLIAGFAFAFIHAAATPAFSWVFSKLLGTFFSPLDDRARLALQWSLCILGVAVADAGASFFMHFLLETCGQAWVDSLRIAAMQRLLDQPCSFFDKDRNSAQKLSECMDRNAEEMRNLVGRFAAFVFVATTMIIISIVWSAMLSWKLTLVGLAVVPILYAISRGFEAVSSRWEKRCNDAAQATGNVFTETFTSIKTVRALTLEGYFHRKFAKTSTRTLLTGLRRGAYSGLFFGLSDSVVPFVIALVFWYGSILASTRQYDVQTILTVLSMLLFSVTNANSVMSFIPQVSSSKDTASRLLHLANLPYGLSLEHRGQTMLASSPGPFAFHNVNFTYPSRPSHPVLNNLDLNIPLHTATAIVGPSGCGKSTLATLLLGLHQPTAPHFPHRPTITLGPYPLSAISLPTLRNLVALVPQHPNIFPASAADNIAYGLQSTSPLAAPAAVVHAATLAGLDPFLRSLPQGYHTMLGDGGSALSGGQAQRLGLARALARRPEVLVLDEPTSALDVENARGVRDLLGRLVREEGVTVVCVTHSWEMMKALGHVVVMGDGRVVEEGSWEELVSIRGGALRRLLGEEMGGRDAR